MSWPRANWSEPTRGDALPDKRAHRGAHPEDRESFAPAAWPRLRRAVHDLSWLLSRRYAEKSALKLVGDHFLLTQRQRLAVMRCSCSDEALRRRQEHRATADQVAGRPLLIDGYNALTTIEAGLAGGVIILGRDGCFRDMASMHGTFRGVTETRPALVLLGELLAGLGFGRCLWYLDSPVSNSGRLKTTIYEVAGQREWNWDVQIVTDPDPILAASEEIIATADSVVLDQCRRWFNLTREVVERSLPDARIVDLSGWDAKPEPSDSLTRR